MSQYKIGTVSTTSGSATVTGSGTNWSGAISVGDLFAVQNPNDPYNIAFEVSSVDSDTQLTLSAPFNATVSGATYILHRDFHPNGNPKFANGDVETAAILNRWTLGTYKISDFGTASNRDVGTADGEIPLAENAVIKDSDTGAANLPSGNIAQRPASPVDGMFRYNGETASFEGYSAGAWSGVGGASGGAGNPFVYLHDKTVTQDFTIPSSQNGVSGGPLTIADGVTITVEDGATWSVV